MVEGLGLGFRVGSDDGADVGNGGDGEEVDMGKREGTFEGLVFGFNVGATDGRGVGFVVTGAGVAATGFVVGLAVEVGSLVGALVGSLVGALVGSLVGAWGFTVGLLVGKAVGGLTPPKDRKYVSIFA